VNDARFYGLSDTNGYAGAIINGFVGGESFATLQSTLSIDRTNASVGDAGVYVEVLVPSLRSNISNNLALDNYRISIKKGNYSIVPAQNLLVRVSADQAVYGTNPNYSISAQYFQTSASAPVDALVLDNGVITITDPNGNSSASFTISAQTVLSDYSTSGKLSAGGYNLVPTGSNVSGNNFKSLTLVGSLTVKPKEISASNLGIAGVSKVYDGTTNITNQSVLNVISTQSQVRARDQVTVKATGTYADKNVGTNKQVTIDVALSGVDAKNYTLPIDTQTLQSITRYVSNIGTITQLEQVSWVGPSNDGRWSNASNWTDGALPDGNNVRTVNIAAGKNVIFDSALVGQVASNINNNGSIIFNGANSFNFNSNVSGSGSITHSNVGILTISGNNSMSGGINVLGGSKLVLAGSGALGSSALTFNGGSLAVQSGLSLAGNLTVNGEVNLLTDISTSGNQTYNGRVLVADGTTNSIDILSVDSNKNIVLSGVESAKVLSLQSSNGSITFNGLVQANLNNLDKKLSLVVNALNGVFINQVVGGNVESINAAGSYAANRFGTQGAYLYDLKINASSGFELAPIAINADVITAGSQTYGSPVTIGDNGSNGFTRSLISLDPAITFNSTVDDSAVGVHTLITKAIANDWSGVKPLVDYQDKVGSTKALNELVTVVGVRSGIDDLGQLNANSSETNRLGTVFIRDDITTVGNQSYSADSAVVGRSGAVDQIVRFTVKGGEVLFDLGSGTGSGVFGASNNVATQFKLGGGTLVGEDYFTSAGIGIEMVPTANPSDLDYLSELKRLASGERAENTYDQTTVGDVAIGNIEDAGDAAKCDAKTDDNCSVKM
jgi:hypothetical protein